MEKNNPQDRILSDEDLTRVNLKIAGAERLTSAEIKVVIAGKVRGDIRRKARKTFKKYGLYRTAQRNGVLVLLVPARREFLVYGDKGIHEKVGQDFWHKTRDCMSGFFREDRFCDGLCAGVHLIGESLARYFPRLDDDIDEISNEVAVEDD